MSTPPAVPGKPLHRGPGRRVRLTPMASGTSPIRTPDQRLRVFISSTIGELAQERDAVDTAVRSLRLIPVRFELGARPHRPDDLYRAYLEQSDIFVGIYWQSYGWVAPGATISGVEDELRRRGDRPCLIYVKEPAPEREAGLESLLEQLRDEGGATYRHFASSGELAELVLDDVAVLVSERFLAGAPAPQDLPTGTVSFLFVDIDSSTALSQTLGDAYSEVEAAFRSLVRDAAEGSGGAVVDADGDGAFCAFPTVEAAALAAVEVQRLLSGHPWPADVVVRARMGIHTGAATRTANGYAGIEVHRAARIGAAANGGQILVSRPAVELLERPRFEGGSVVDLGSYALKGLDRTERLFQLVGPGLAEERPAPRARGARLVHLPPQLTELVGRDTEVEQVAKRFSQHHARLVTLVGPGGIGKSRLAVASALRVAEGYPDGVFFVPLAEARTPDHVIAALGSSLGVQHEGAQPLLETIQGRLAAARAFLVLDNFEQVTEASTTVVEILESCPGVDVLVTSRVPLRVRGEHEHAVPPLAVPSPTADAAATAQAHAVRLFIERARASRAGWEPGAGDVEAIAEICRRLDGLPLAIELAAARLRVLDPAALLERLDRKLDVVGGSLPDLPARQRTLTATIEWSVDLLAEAERTLLSRLAVFAGGWSLDAAEAVCQDERVPDVLSSLERLVEHSLVVSEVGVSAATRMRMLETIAEFARARLDESGELDALRDRQGAYFDDLIPSFYSRVTGPAGAEALLRIDDEWDDLVAVMGRRDEREEYASLVNATSLIWGYIWLRSRVREAASWLHGAYLARETLEPALRGELCRLWGATCYRTGRFDEAKEAIEEAIELLEVWGPPDREAWARTLLAGLLPYYDDDFDRPLAEMSRAVEIFREEGNPFGLGTTLGMAGTILSLVGRGDEGMPRFDEAIAVARQIRLPALIGSNQTLKALGCLATDDLEGAGNVSSSPPPRLSTSKVRRTGSRGSRQSPWQRVMKSARESRTEPQRPFASAPGCRCGRSCRRSSQAASRRWSPQAPRWRRRAMQGGR